MKKIIDLIKSLLGVSSPASKAITIKKLDIEVKKEVAQVKQKLTRDKKEIDDAVKPAEKKKKRYYPAQPGAGKNKK